MLSYLACSYRWLWLGLPHVCSLRFASCRHFGCGVSRIWARISAPSRILNIWKPSTMTQTRDCSSQQRHGYQSFAAEGVVSTHLPNEILFLFITHEIRDIIHAVRSRYAVLRKIYHRSLFAASFVRSDGQKQLEPCACRACGAMWLFKASAQSRE